MAKSFDKKRGIRVRLGELVSHVRNRTGLETLDDLEAGLQSGERKAEAIDLIRKKAKEDPTSPEGELYLSICAAEGNTADAKTLLDAGTRPDMGRYQGDSALVNACREGNAEITEALLKRGADPKMRTDSSSTPISAACHAGHRDCAQLLLTTGSIDVNQVGPHFGDPLLHTAMNSSVDLAIDLLDRGAKPNSSNVRGETALHKASFSANARASTKRHQARKDDETIEHDYQKEEEREIPDTIRLIDALVSKGADINAVDKFGEVPLSRAYVGGPAVVEAMLRHGADPNRGQSLQKLCQYFPGKRDDFDSPQGKQGLVMLDLLLKAGADPNVPNEHGQHPFDIIEQTVKGALGEAAKAKLVEYGAVPPSKPSRAPMRHGPGTEIRAEGNILSLAGMELPDLIPSGAPIDPKHEELAGRRMRVAIRADDMRAVRQLMEAYGFPAVKAAVGPEKTNEAAVQVVREAALTQPTNRYGSLMVALAAQRDDPETAAHLLQKGANPDAESLTYGRALVIAALNGSLPMVDLLIAYKADLEHSDGWKGTPLQAASENRHFEVVKALHRAGTDLNHFDPEHSYPPLVSAIGSRQDSTEMLEYFLKHGADVSIRGDRGGMALYHATLQDNVAAAKLLLAYGADANAKGEFSLRIAPKPIICNAKSPEMLGLLLKAGANPNVQGTNGYAPISSVCNLYFMSVGELTPKFEMLTHLLGANANPNVTAKHGDDYRTPLMSIAIDIPSFGSETERAMPARMATLLIEHGADLHTTDGKGRTARDLAKDNPAVLAVIDAALAAPPQAQRTKSLLASTIPHPNRGRGESAPER